MTIGKIHPRTGSEPFEELPVHFQKGGISLHIRAQKNTLHIVITEGKICMASGITRIKGKFISLGDAFPCKYILPVCPCSLGFRIREWSFIIFLIVKVHQFRVHVTILRKLRSIHHIKFPGKFGQAHIRSKADLKFGCLLTLGSHENHTVGSTRSVNGRRRCILQNCDTLDVIRIDVGETLHCIHHTVDHDERVVSGRNGSCTADTDGRSSARLTAETHDVHTGDTALKGLVRRNSNRRDHLVHLHDSDRTGQVALGSSTITDHDRLFNHLIVKFKDDIDSLVALIFHPLLHITETVVDDHIVHLHPFQGIFTIGIGHDTVGCSCHHHSHSHDRHTVVTHDLTAHGHSLLCPSIKREQKRSCTYQK